jgi:hypothetical protein
MEFITIVSHVTIHGIKQEKYEPNIKLLAFISLLLEYIVHPREGERFNLQLLLYHVIWTKSNEAYALLVGQFMPPTKTLQHFKDY